MNKHSRKDIQKAWQDFQSGKPVGTNVRKIILDSWTRSKHYGVNAFYLNKKLHSLENVRKRQENSRRLLDAAHDYLENIYTIILNKQGVVVLSDPEGVIIFVLGDEKTLRETTALDLGSDCREEIIGTNGVGTCLALKQPIQIWAEEHYCLDNHCWYCSGTPIFDPEGKILGCLNVTGTSESVHAHTLGMVIGVGNAIERQIRIDQITAENQKVIRLQGIMLDLISDGVLIVDPSGNVTDINNKALQLFGIAKNKVVNQPLTKFAPSGIDINEILTNRRMINNIEIDFTLPGKDFCVAFPQLLLRTNKACRKA
ncbi:MAG: PAS domain-containing protein [Desulfosporosinus sp.]